jgi:hypothetical protein
MKMTTQRIAEQGRRPNLFIAGFAKRGTTELCDYLSQHPAIFLPYEKEHHTFYDLAKYPAYFSADHTGNRRNPIFCLNDCYKLFSKGKKHRYRIDGIVSYTFDPKFSVILKSFSENAKVILLIRNQTHRLISVYFHSFLIHRENDFTKWVQDYFFPYIKTFLYHDKIVAYYNEFGADNLRIIEANNLSSYDVHKQLFEYLEVKPFKISIRHKNVTLLGSGDNKTYRELILTLTSIKLGLLKAAQRIGLENQTTKAYYILGNVAREVFKHRRHDRKKSDNNYYSNMIKLIPDNISSVLLEDYRKTVDFAVEKRILIRHTC